jgi:hypothetical protein
MNKSLIDTEREVFRTSDAQRLADAIGVPKSTKGASPRFAYFADSRRLAIVAGAQERGDIDLALAYGLTECGERSLALVLPSEWAFPTLQRYPWIDKKVSVYTYDGNKAPRLEAVTRDATIRNIREVCGISDTATFEEELTKASAPLHLGSHRSLLGNFTEWATKHPLLDPSHRRDVRSWQCMGRRVLSIKKIKGGVRISAGIHVENVDHIDLVGKTLSPANFAKIKSWVRRGIKTRLNRKSKYGRPDENWLQAAIQRYPSAVGIEVPVLRELPAWRPAIIKDKRGKTLRRWGRGYIDVIGVDSHGDIRIGEAKLSENSDAMFILQGLDYYMWATAYEQALRTRFGISGKSSVVVHYLIGVNEKGDPTTSRFAKVQASALTIPRKYQTVAGWERGPDEAPRMRTRIFDALPT